MDIADPQIAPNIIINKCICHGFYFVHCIQFSQLSDLDIVQVGLKSEVRAVDGTTTWVQLQRLHTCSESVLK